MKVLSLFDGISCGRIALERAGIIVDKYYASEIDKNAIKVSQDNYNDIIQLGDINNWKQWNIDWSKIDLLIGGSPCQSFSFAGKQEGLEGKSGLFDVYIDVLNHLKNVNPNIKFLLENVKMKKEFQDYISSKIGVQPVLINSSLVSAQLRNRFYWCNWKVEQPKDKGILLKDIIEDGYTDREKSRCLLESESRPLKSKEKMVYRYYEIGFITLVWKDKELSDYAKSRVKERLNEKTGIVYNWFSNRISDEKANCLLSGSLSWSGKSTSLVIKDNDIRYLNQLELERLQTLPEGYTKSVNRNKAAGLIGNGWTVDVIVHILKNLIKK